jgi:hypothetical protein
LLRCSPSQPVGCPMTPLFSCSQTPGTCVVRTATNINTAHSPSVVQDNRPIYCKRISANAQTLANR